MKRILIAIAALAAVAIIAALLMRRGEGGAHARVPPPAVPVTVRRPTVRDIPVWITGVGTVQALNNVDVKVRVDGQLDSVAFTEGADVKQNQVLAQIDPRPFQAQLDLARANLGRDAAQLAEAKVNLARFEKLTKIGAAPSQNVDTFRAQVAQLTAATAGDRAQIDTARLNLEFTTIRSPLDGRVGLRQVDPGAIVHATDTAGLVTVTQMDPIAVLFSLPQDQLPAALAVRGEQAVTAYTRDGARSLAQGELAVVDNTVDPTTGQVRIKAVFKNQARTLWPGELVSVRVLARTDRGALVVPAQAVLRGQTGPYVFVVDKGSTIAARPVKLGASSDGVTAVLEGVTASDTVVIAGQERVAPGTRVAAKDGA